MELLHKEVFKEIENRLSIFLRVDEKRKRMEINSMVNICMELYLGYVFPYVINIKTRGLEFTENLNYVNISFRCGWYKTYDHMKHAYTKIWKDDILDDMYPMLSHLGYQRHVLIKYGDEI